MPRVVLVDEGARYDRPPHDGGEVLGRYRVQYAEGVAEALRPPRDQHQLLEHPAQHLLLLRVALVERDLCARQEARSGASEANTHACLCACLLPPGHLSAGFFGD